jgi:hypothetical protein
MIIDTNEQERIGTKRLFLRVVIFIIGISVNPTKESGVKDKFPR